MGFRPEGSRKILDLILGSKSCWGGGVRGVVWDTPPRGGGGGLGHPPPLTSFGQKALPRRPLVCVGRGGSLASVAWSPPVGRRGGTHLEARGWGGPQVDEHVCPLGGGGGGGGAGPRYQRGGRGRSGESGGGRTWPRAAENSPQMEGGNCNNRSSTVEAQQVLRSAVCPILGAVGRGTGAGREGREGGPGRGPPGGRPAAPVGGGEGVGRQIPARTVRRGGPPC